MDFSWAFGIVWNDPPCARYALGAELARARFGSIASGLECREFRGELTHAIGADIESTTARSLFDYRHSLEVAGGCLEVGGRLGIRGMPALILDNRIVRDYVPAGCPAELSP